MGWFWNDNVIPVCISLLIKGQQCKVNQVSWLKGWSRGGLLCFYWCRWQARNILHLFWFVHFLGCHRFHVEFSLKDVPRWCLVSVDKNNPPWIKEVKIWYLVCALICTSKIYLAIQENIRVFCTKMARTFQQCTNCCEISLPSIP
jgi:hypothetical protein